jgi:hypothetical protein
MHFIKPQVLKSLRFACKSVLVEFPSYAQISTFEIGSLAIKYFSKISISFTQVLLRIQYMYVFPKFAYMYVHCYVRKSFLKLVLLCIIVSPCVGTY